MLLINFLITKQEIRFRHQDGIDWNGLEWIYDADDYGYFDGADSYGFFDGLLDAGGADGDAEVAEVMIIRLL